MARAKNPLFSEQASGQMGGLLFRRGTYGPVVSRRSSAPHLMTPAQTAHRCLLAAAHRSFTALSESEQAAWGRYATPPETARNAYFRAYVIGAKMGVTPALPADPSYEIGLFSVTSATAFAPPVLSSHFEWDYSGSVSCRILFYALHTWSEREFPKPSKLVYAARVGANVLSADVALPFSCPVHWFRLELRGRYTGRLLQSRLIRLVEE